MESTDLQPLELPAREDDWLDWMTERAQGGLSTAGAVIATLKLTPDGDAADLVADFLGRPYDKRAYAAWLASEPDGAEEAR